MQLHNFPHRRLIGAAALACAAALIPAAALAATTSPAAPAGAGNAAATVPAGFLPTWSSFYSPASGVVLGTVSCQPISGKSCTARLAATTDSGARWHPVTPPDVMVSVTVSGVVFASGRDGWLYGPGLYATHDGGAHWRKLSLGGGIDTMAVSAGTVYAVVSPPGGKPEELFASPAGKNAWTRVGTMTAGRALLAVSGKAAWFANGTEDVGSTYVWATADGRHWHKYRFGCPASGHGTGTIDYGLSSVAAASPSDVLFLCIGGESMHFSDKEVLASANGGKTAHLTGRPPTLGIGGVIAVPPHRPGLITLATEYAVDRSASGGKTWKQVLFNSGGASLTSLAFVSTTVGWAVFPQGAKSRLMRTTDAGASWHQVPIPAAPARPVTAYVANQGSDTVTPINTATNTALKPIRVGPDPRAIAITPNGKTAYVANTGGITAPGDTVSPISTGTNKVGRQIKVGSGPGDIAITPDGKTAYVANSLSSTVTPIRTATNTALKAINVGGRPYAIAITPNGKTAYVATGLGLVPIAIATNTPGKAIKGLSGPIALTPNGKTLYAVNDLSGTVIPISTATDTAGKPIKVGSGPGDIAITPDGKTAYVVINSPLVIPISTATNTAGKPIKVGSGPGDIAITPNGRTVYVTNVSSDTVTPINAITDTAGKPIKVGSDPFNIAITPNGKTAYAVNDVSGTVTPISTATNTALRAIKVGKGPFAIAITP